MHRCRFGIANRRIACLLASAALVTVLTMTPLGPLAAAETNGEWQTKSQLVFDAGTQSLVRKTFRVWNAQPELDLEFNWVQQAGASEADGTVNGAGVLTWRLKGSAPYDRKGVYSEYRGEMHDGRPHGSGTLTVQSGLFYEGAWQDGAMAGQGAIKYPNGDDYAGEFAASAPHGQGRYAAADGSTFDGAFRNGERHGEGTLTLPEGVAYRTTWDSGIETTRMPLDPAHDGEIQVAQAAPRVTLKAYTDRQRNQKFVKDDENFKSFVYDQETTPNGVRIRLADKAILDVWKGNARIPPYLQLFEESLQFAPALLVVEMVNETAQAIQFVGGYVDVEESYTDLQPFLNFIPPHGSCGAPGASMDGKFLPEMEFVNYGWGGVKNATVTYGFGRTPSDPTYTADVGSFDKSGKVSMLDGIRRAGLNVEKVRQGGFKCRSNAQLPVCTQQLLATGIMGRAAGSVVRENATLLLRTTGRINYSWTDASGATQPRQSPISVDFPLLTFEVGDTAECGAPGPVERDLKPVKFSLDKKNYRIPLGYRGALAPRQNRRFALALEAEKSSQHYFKIVLELADGRTITTTRYDFNYFLPNMPQSDDTPDPPPGQNPPGR
jgi:hypothetical protein